MRSRWRKTPLPCCAKSGGSWPEAGGCSSWCRTGAACGRGSTRRRSVTADLIRARRSPTSCVKPGSRPPAGAKPCTCLQSHAAGSCVRRSRGSGRDRRSPHHSRACTSSKRRSRSIAPFRRAVNACDWCQRWSLRSHPESQCGEVFADRALRSLSALRRLVATVSAALHVVARTAMTSAAAMQRKAVGLAIMAVRPWLGSLGMLLRLLPASDEGRQPVDVAFGGSAPLLWPRLVRLVLLMPGEGLCVARDIGLPLARAVGRFASSAHVGRALLVAVIELFGRSFVLRT